MLVGAWKEDGHARYGYWWNGNDCSAKCRRPDESRGGGARAVTRSGANALTGEGLVAALEGIDIVVDGLNIKTLLAGPARRFFSTTANHVAYAARVNGVQRVVCVSIVNAANGFRRAVASCGHSCGCRDL